MKAPPTDLPIMLQDVSVLVGELAILDRVTLALKPGRPSVVIGPNGSGKTTLLRVLMGLIDPSSGTVTWGGRERVPPHRRAFMFQRPVMLRRSAAGNIAYALSAVGLARRERAARVADLLRQVGLAHLGDRPARRMSGGEQQRLALARALARDPEVLFLDEPAASLDPAATKAIEDLIAAITARGIKVVMSTHDLGQARRLAGEVVLMHRGCVVECSDAEPFFSSPESPEGRAFVAGELLV